jgi:transposase
VDYRMRLAHSLRTDRGDGDNHRRTDGATRGTRRRSAEKFYAALPQPVRVGIEATGTTQWFERLLARLGHELWAGDAAAIRAAVVRQQKTDTRDAQRLGAISKQGNTLVRWLLVEAAQTAARLDPELHGDYVRLKFRRGARITKVAIARKLAVRMYWMLRTPDQHAQRVSLQDSPESSMVDASPS